LTVLTITSSSSEGSYIQERQGNARQMIDCHGYRSFRSWGMPSRSFIIIILVLSSIILIPSSTFDINRSTAYAAYTRAILGAGGPTVNDPNLKVEVVAKGLEIPTSMAFLGPNDILVLEKNTGDVSKVLNGEILKTPLLHVNVATPFIEWGLLGIAVSKTSNANEPRNVFIYYTKSGGTTGVAAGNMLYRYDLTTDNSQLINPKLLLDLPANTSNPTAESNHNGGKVLIGPDSNVYAVIGDVGGHQGQAQNVERGTLDGTSGILRVTQDGEPVGNGIFGNTAPDNAYYAYGIRNSFGIDFDPLTGKLWDTENGPTFGDEINLVNPGFNSGWSQVMGIWKAGPHPGPVIGADNNNPPKNLLSLGRTGEYRAPEFTWLPTIGPTALKFFDSPKLGSQYQHDMFVGDVNTGSLYHFKLNQQRDGLTLTGALADKVANTPQESQQVVFGQGFGTITDLQVGPDGYLYVLTFGGNIYRIVPLHPISNNGNTGNELESTSNTPSTSSSINNNNIPSSINNQQPTPNQQHHQKRSDKESNNNVGGVIGTIIPEHTPSRIIK
jgi:glucose/arabinose dehydrogenase